MAGGRAGGRGGRDGRTDNLEDIYERDDVAQEARTEARFQQLEQSMTAAIAALADQVAALAVGGNPPRHQPYNRRPREEDESTDGEAAENLFAAGHSALAGLATVAFINKGAEAGRSWLITVISVHGSRV